jgi:hypothetical protein
VDFPHFQLSKICVSPTDVVSSPSSLWCRLSFDRRRHSGAPCHTFFPWRQGELAVSASSSDNVSSRRLSSQAEIEVLNLHHRRRPPSLDRPTPTLHCYKKFILTLITLSTTQPHLHFACSIARAPRHQSSIYRR